MTTRSLPRWLGRTAGLALLPVTLLADSKATLDLLFSTTEFREAALSPDGQSVAWVEAHPEKVRPELVNSFVFVLGPGGPRAHRATTYAGKAVHSEIGLAWSPDGARLAFLCNDPGSKQLQLRTVAAAGGPVKTLTGLSGHLDQPKWSPDGKTIAVLLIEGLKGEAGATQAAPRESGEIEETIHEQRIALVDAATGRVRLLSPSDTYVYEFDWSPDGRQIAYTAAKGSGDNNWWIARLYACAVDSGAVRELYIPRTQIAVPRWSPDGMSLAFIEGLMSDAGATGGEIHCLPSAGGVARNLTPGRKSSPAWIHWLPGSGRLLFTERVRGASAVATLDVASGRTETLWQADESMAAGGDDLSLSVSADGNRAAVIRSSWSLPPEVWSGPIGAWKPKTAANGGLKPLWGKAETVRWTCDGRDVQGWLLFPRAFDPARNYPMVVSIHGGPASQKSPLWPRTWFDLSVMAAEGYFVFFPNPRGSYGQGEAFTSANVRDFGRGDLRDILSGVDTVMQRVPVDGKRLGVGGWSYGGYMAMWAVTQTGRFHAAVAGAGLANWQSYYGQNLIDQWMLPYFGASVYDDPETYASSSPIRFIKDVRTPTLIVVGDSDKECPSPQSYEFWHALKTLGVKTKLVVYENEGHHFQNPAHIVDLIARSVAWFNENLP